jgi:hypothetical protein
MSWEQRVREMILAGGALTATACGGSTAAQADAATTTTPNLGDDSADPGQINCCNASSDPCCYLSCEPDAAISPACEQQTECFDHGGTTGPDGVCRVPQSLPGPEAGSPDAETSDGGAADAGPVDAAPTDATEDVVFYFPCCNANSDPCCPIAFCSGGVGPDAAPYITCEQSRTQCQSNSGYYQYQPDGSLGCTPTSATGH